MASYTDEQLASLAASKLHLDAASKIKDLDVSEINKKVAEYQSNGKVTMQIKII